MSIPGGFGALRDIAAEKPFCAVAADVCLPWTERLFCALKPMKNCIKNTKNSLQICRKYHIITLQQDDVKIISL
ncbi:MAG: hypothetical protein PUE99_08920 [Anaerovibrio sp.]|nr:hypothetical protein [Anaerovibrio sp.]